MKAELAEHEVVRRAEARLGERYGLQFGASRKKDVERALRRRSETLAELDSIVGTDEGIDALLEEVRIGESWFFRDPVQLDALIERVRERGDVRIWSAGCSSGEETWSVAALLETHGIPGRVIGTDASQRAIVHARRAVYRDWSFRGDVDPALSPFFERRGKHWAVTDRLRERVSFRRHNLLGEEPGPIGCDAILCRNVLLYIDPAHFDTLASRFADALIEGGVLASGASDPLLVHPSLETRIGTSGVFHIRVTARRSAPGELVQVISTRPSPRSRRPSPAPAFRRDVPSVPLPAPAFRRDVPSAPPPSPERAVPSVTPPPPEHAVLSVTPPPATEGSPLEALVELAARDPRAALERARRARVDDPSSAALLQLTAWLCLDLGELPEALHAARAMTFTNVEDPVGWYLLGETRCRCGQPEGAARAFREAALRCADHPADEEVPGSGGETFGALGRGARSRWLELDRGAR